MGKSSGEVKLDPVMSLFTESQMAYIQSKSVSLISVKAKIVRWLPFVLLSSVVFRSSDPWLRRLHKWRTKIRRKK